jgi:hypothetical protein
MVVSSPGAGLTLILADRLGAILPPDFTLPSELDKADSDDVIVELNRKAQRGDLADDVRAALEASPAAAAFVDTLSQFYRKTYLRWIDATTRRPDLRASRIAEVAHLLAAGIKERPRSSPSA